MQPLFFHKKKSKNKLSSCPCMELNISLHFYLYLKKKQSVVTYQSCRLQRDFQGGLY